MPKLAFTVSSVNDGPAPFDVIGTDENDTELRIRFQTDDPQVEVGTVINVTYTAAAKSTPEADAPM